MSRLLWFGQTAPVSAIGELGAFSVRIVPDPTEPSTTSATSAFWAKLLEMTLQKG